MKETIFTKIVAGEIPSTRIYEDESTFAFLDIAPNALGHTLVIPKEPFENIYEIPDDVLSRVMSTVKKVSIAAKAGLGADGIKIFMNNGEAAGQDVFHVHFHVVPRFKGDSFEHGKHISYKEGEMFEVAEKIKNHL